MKFGHQLVRLPFPEFRIGFAIVPNHGSGFYFHRTAGGHAGVMVIAFFAAIGLPGLSGFISEAFSFLGAFQTFKWLTMASAFGIVLTAGYMLWTLQRVFLGTLPEKWNGLTDMNSRELAMLVPLAVIVIVLGVYPNLMLDVMTSSANTLVDFVKGSAGMALGN